MKLTFLFSPILFSYHVNVHACKDCCVGLDACKDSTATVGDGSCNQMSACEGTSGIIGTNSCASGAFSDAFACMLSSATIGDNSCNSYSACFETTNTIQSNSCNAHGACSFSTASSIGESSCNEKSACSYSSGAIGSESCNGWSACFESTGTVSDSSCNGFHACECTYNYATADCTGGHLGNIGCNSCNGDSACSQSKVNIGNNACNGDYACSCPDPKGDGTDVGDNECNLDSTGSKTCCPPTAACCPQPSTTFTCSSGTSPSISPSPSPSSSPSSEPCCDNICFSGRSTVQVKGKIKPIRMDELQIGDFVMTAQESFSMVYSFGHKASWLRTKYLQIFAEFMKNDQPLEISAEHMIYIHDAITSEPTLVAAGELRVGDKLVTTYGRNSSIILWIHEVESEGAYSPLTVSGNLLVNGVLASSYVSRQWLKNRVSGDTLHEFQHGATLPVRFLCSVLLNCDNIEHYDKMTGLSSWVHFWFKVEQWMLTLPTICQNCFLLVLIVPALWIMLLGKVLLTPIPVIHGVWTVSHGLVAALFMLVYWFLIVDKKNKQRNCIFIGAKK